MADTKPITRWAVSSLVCSVLGWLVSLTLVAMGDHYNDIISGTAGVGAFLVFLHLMLATTVFLLAILFGLVALVRLRSGKYRGYGIALPGIVLACLALVALVLSPLRRLL
jgi:hypothetical protein